MHQGYQISPRSPGKRMTERKKYVEWMSVLFNTFLIHALKWPINALHQIYLAVNCWFAGPSKNEINVGWKYDTYKSPLN